jgi:hypothetical protein
MGIEFFTNEKKTAEEKVDVDSPAFSLTKVQTSLGGVIAAVLAVAPKALQEDETVVVAAFAAGTLILLGVFALAAVDIVTRQKAKAATLRYGDGEPAPAAKFQALPTKDLVLQLGHNSNEYDIKYATVDGDVVRVYADRDGEDDPISVTFKEVPKPK